MPKLVSLLRWMSLCMLATGLAGCASNDEQFAPMPREPGRSLTLDTHQKPLQCVPYAREHSAVKIYGDAWTWWDQATGKYRQGSVPQTGTVMVLADYAGPERGHLAVVRKIVSPREIRVDHANWLDDGSIYLNNPVEDVSSANDWSQVRVYNIQTGGWGAKVYPVRGFIGAPDSNSVQDAPTQSVPSDDGQDGDDTLTANDLVARADVSQDHR